MTQALSPKAPAPGEISALVRVISAEHREQYGCVFEVMSTDGDHLKLRSVGDKMRLCRIPSKHTIEVSKDFKPIDICTLMRQSRTFKQEAMILGGLSNPNLAGSIEKLNTSMSGGPLPNFDHVDLGMAQLTLSFQDRTVVKPKFTILPAMSVHSWTSEQRGPDNKDFFERFDMLLSKLHLSRPLLLLPIADGKHFTLLAVSNGEARYPVAGKPTQAPQLPPSPQPPPTRTRPGRPQGHPAPPTHPHTPLSYHFWPI